MPGSEGKAMTAIFLAVAVLSLAAGFYILYSGRRSPEREVPANHKVNIRKAAGPALQEVLKNPPEGLSAIEAEALEQEEEDPIDIFLDLDLPFDCRQEAQEKLIGAGFKFSSSLLKEDSHKDNPNKNDSDVDGDDTSATDEDLRPDLVLTGE